MDGKIDKEKEWLAVLFNIFLEASAVIVRPPMSQKRILTVKDGSTLSYLLLFLNPDILKAFEPLGGFTKDRSISIS